MIKLFNFFISIVGRPLRICRHGPHGLLVKLVSLAFIVSVLFFSLYQYKQITTNSTAPVFDLGPAYHLMQANKTTHFDNLEALDLLPGDEKRKTVKLLRNVVKNLISECTKQNTDGCANKSQEGVAILTLFTTWVFDADKFSVNNRTLVNWRMLPDVNLIVFSNCSIVKKYSEAAGWTVLPVTREVANVPELPYMFNEAKRLFKSHFYGFANADILFTANGLVRTLHKLHCDLEKMNEKNVLLVGRRTNIPAALLTDEITGSVSKLEDFVLKFGSLFVPMAEDYFITDIFFPWSKVLPVAVGRRVYDNYIVAYARDSNATVIDVSDSVQCLHQTVEARGNFEGLQKGQYNTYNYDLIKKHGGPGSRFFGSRGRTDCSPLLTWEDICGRIHLGRRETFEKECNSATLNQHLQSFFGLNWGA